MPSIGIYIGINKRKGGGVANPFPPILTDGTCSMRQRIVGDYFRTEKTIAGSLLGFAGVEDTDWEVADVEAFFPVTIEDKMLFWGKVSEISGGEMPNRISGATDFLTVGGSAGSYTFECPNTAPYIAADTDYIWFKTDTTQRTATEAELIGYDLQRTPVKYDNLNPCLIREIIILKAGETLTASERNELFGYMSLPIMWDNSWNDIGVSKDNRSPIEQILWTPETVLPTLFTDANVFTWMPFDDETILTKVGGLCSVMADKNGSGNDLLQAGADNIKPVWASGVLSIDGVRQYADMGAKVLSRPITVYAVVRQTVWNSNGRLWEGVVNSDSIIMAQTVGSPQLRPSASGGIATTSDAAVNAWVLLTGIWTSGADCSLQVDDHAAITGTFGGSDPNGFSIGRNWGSYAGVDYRELLVRKGKDSAEDIVTIKAFLKSKHDDVLTY